MKDISSMEKSKEVISGLRANRESLYYTILFGAASIVAVVLLIVAFVQKNSPLKVYTYIMLPVFALATTAAARYTFVSKDRIYTKCGVLVIKSFFITRRFKIENIDRLTAATNNKDNVTTVNVVVGDRTASYKFKNMSKEEIAHLRRATQKH